MSTLRGPAQLADLQGALYVPTLEPYKWHRRQDTNLRVKSQWVSKPSLSCVLLCQQDSHRTTQDVVRRALASHERAMATTGVHRLLRVRYSARRNAYQYVRLTPQQLETRFRD